MISGEGKLWEGRRKVGKIKEGPQRSARRKRLGIQTVNPRKEGRARGENPEIGGVAAQEREKKNWRVWGALRAGRVQRKNKFGATVQKKK